MITYKQIKSDPVIRTYVQSADESLAALGYTLREYTPVDLFPRTHHVETVALLTRER